MSEPPITVINVHNATTIRLTRLSSDDRRSWLSIEVGNGNVFTVHLPSGKRWQLRMLEQLRDDVGEAIESVQKAIIDTNHAELTVVRHEAPDPPTQEGCTSCGNDLRHGFVVGDRVVMVAPMTARQHGIITGFSLDKANVVVDGRNYPTTIHSKWLALEELVDAPAVTPATIDDRELSAEAHIDTLTAERDVALSGMQQLERACEQQSAHIDTLTAEVRQAFTDTRRMYVALPEQGADSVDAAIGSALNDAEAAVLAILRPDPDAGGRPDPDAEGIKRDLARENAYFGRTQGWDPSRPDGE